MKFEIPYFTTSGIQVRYLKIIEKSGYQALPWVRYITQNGGVQRTLCCDNSLAVLLMCRPRAGFAPIVLVSTVFCIGSCAKRKMSLA